MTKRLELGEPSRHPVRASSPGDDPAVSPRSWRSRDVLTAAAIVALATALRLPALSPPSLWVDDAAPTLVIKAHGLRDLLLVGSTFPGFVLTLKGWLGIVGFTNSRALVLPLVGGVLSPALLYVLAVRRGVSRWAGFIGAVVLATSPAVVTYSTRVKPYALEVLIAVLILFACSRLVDDPSSLRLWGYALAACIVGTVFSGLVSVVAIASLATVLVAARGRRAPHRALGGAAVYGLFLLVWWIAVLRPATNEALRTYWSGFYIPLDGGASTALVSLGRGLQRTILSMTGFPIAAVAGALVVAGVWAVGRKRPLHLGLLLGPFVLAVVLAAAKQAPVGTRGNLALLPGLALLTGIGAQEICSRLLRRHFTRNGVIRVTLGLALCIGLIYYGKPLGDYPVEDIKPLVVPMEASAQEQYAVVVSSASALAFGLYSDMPVRFVKSKAGFRVRIGYPAVFVLPEYEAGPGPVRTTLEDIVREHSRVWFVVSHGQPGDRTVVDELRKDGFAQTKTVASDGAVATLWERRFS